MVPERSEASYVVHTVIPLFEELGYPVAGDHERVKINDVPVYRPSGGRSGSTMDIVYYHNREPLLLVEAKRRHRFHEKALQEAKNYLRNFPKDNSEFAASGKAPQYIATTVGGEIKFYKHWFDIIGGQLEQKIEELQRSLTFDELITEYGLKPEFTPQRLTPIDFKEKFLNELISVFVFNVNEGITPEVMKNIVKLILVYLQYPQNYTNQSPYIELEDYPERQRHIRDLFRRYNLLDSLGPEFALEFRNFILRAFQGSNQLNQYITPWSVIIFMSQLISLRSNDKVLDFECGSGGFISAAVQTGVSLQNVRGVDIADLPYYVSRLFLVLNFNIQGDNITEDNPPIYRDNGLFFQGDDWDVIIGNPAGGSKYDPQGELNDLAQVYENLERDLNGDGRSDPTSEYNFSIQQAVRSAKVGGRICLVLPEGFFSNSSAEFLRKYVVKYCRIKAVISLPRGVFHKGTTTRQVRAGHQIAQMKMSVLFVEKIKPVVPKSGVDLSEEDLDYFVFLASVKKPVNIENDAEWLQQSLERVLKNYKEWQETGTLLINNEFLEFKISKKVKKISKKQLSINIEKTKKKTTKNKLKKPPSKEKTIIPDNLKDIF